MKNICHRVSDQISYKEMIFGNQHFCTGIKMLLFFRQR